MNRIIAAFKKFRPVLTTFLVGALLFMSTACGNARVQAKTPDTGVEMRGSRQEVPAGKIAVPGKPNPRPEVPDDAKTNSDFNRPNTMNEFSDLQPGTKGVEAANNKAKALIDNAERNVIDQTGSVGKNTERILDKKGENAADFGKNLQRNTEDLKNKAQDTAEDLAKGTKRGTENIKGNTQDATRDAQRAAEDTKDSAKQAARNTQRAVDKAVD